MSELHAAHPPIGRYLERTAEEDRSRRRLPNCLGTCDAVLGQRALAGV